MIPIDLRPGGAGGNRNRDLVTAVDGAPATSTDQLLALTLTKRAGATLELKVERDGGPHDCTVTLGTAR